MSGSTSIGNGPREGIGPNDPPPDDKSTLMPGAELLPGEQSVEKEACVGCNGSGKMPDGSECKACRGSGRMEPS